MNADLTSIMVDLSCVLDAMLHVARTNCAATRNDCKTTIDRLMSGIHGRDIQIRARHDQRIPFPARYSAGNNSRCAACPWPFDTPLGATWGSFVIVSN